MLNTFMIGGLLYLYLRLEKKVDRNSKIVGSLKIDDLDEEFWDN